MKTSINDSTKDSLIIPALLLAGLLQVATVVHANPTVEVNGLITARDGRTLYTFDKDSAGKSACSGACSAAWPAFTVANPKLAGGDFSIVVRDDGSAQWAFQGKPLYFFAGDARPGEVNGDGQGGVWRALRMERAAAARTRDDAYAADRPGGYRY
jgi:predicted lipoprotein with Yx(FWY)xxD motif